MHRSSLFPSGLEEKPGVVVILTLVNLVCTKQVGLQGIVNVVHICGDYNCVSFITGWHLRRLPHTEIRPVPGNTLLQEVCLIWNVGAFDMQIKFSFQSQIYCCIPGICWKCWLKVQGVDILQQWQVPYGEWTWVWKEWLVALSSLEQWGKRSCIQLSCVPVMAAAMPLHSWMDVFRDEGVT